MLFAAIFGLLLSTVVISANLQSDIEDVVSHLPMGEIESIGKQYVAAYPSYRNRLRYMEEIPHEQLVKGFFQTPEGREIIEYFNDRGIDVKSLILYMTEVVMDISRKWLEPGVISGPAISGDFIDDYTNAIVKSGFLDVVHKKMETSSEFANLVAAVKEPKFKTLLYRSVNGKSLTGFGVKAEVRWWWLIRWVPLLVKGIVCLFDDRKCN